MEKESMDCDLCGHTKTRSSDRYCKTCTTDPYRRIIWQLHETIGHDDYTVRWIRCLEDEKNTVIKLVVTFLKADKHSTEFPKALDDLMRYLEKIGAIVPPEKTKEVESNDSSK